MPVSRDLESEPLIGIITALPKEYAAVHAMLDEPVDTTEVPAASTSTSLGRYAGSIAAPTE